MYGIPESKQYLVWDEIFDMARFGMFNALDHVTDRDKRWELIREYNEAVLITAWHMRDLYIEKGGFENVFDSYWHDKTFSNETFDGCFIRGSALVNCTFRNCKIQMTNFFHSAMKNCVFDNCVFTCSILGDMVDLENVTFNNCKFIDSCFYLYERDCGTNEYAYDDYYYEEDDDDDWLHGSRKRNVITPERISVKETRIENLKFNNCISSYILTLDPEVN